MEKDLTGLDTCRLHSQFPIMTQNDESKIDALLTSLWERGLPLLRERLDVLDRAATATGAGELSQDLRIEAVEIAHKLAGSLGMFGYDHGTEVARQIEQLLGVPPRATNHLTALVGQLRETLQIG